MYTQAKELVFTNPKQALELALQAVALAQREEHLREEGYGLLVQGIAHFMLNAPNEAYGTWMRALVVFRTVGDDAGTMECKSNVGNYFLAHSDFSSALQCYEEVLRLSRSIGNVYREVSTLNNMGTLSKAIGEYPKAVAYHKQALELADKHLSAECGRISVQIIAFNNLASLYWELGAVADAVEYFTHALHLVQQVGDTYRESGLYNNLGSVYEAIENHNRAVEYYQQGITLARQLGHEREMLLPLINLSSVCRKVEQREEAQGYVEEALMLARSIGARAEEALALGTIGVGYEERREYDKAEEYLTQALALYRELGVREGEMKVLSTLGNIYVLQGDTSRALPVLHEALAIAEQMAMKTRQFEVYRHLARAYKIAGDFEQALLYHERYCDEEREVFNAEMDKRVQHLMLQLHIERTERERELYRRKAELLEQEVEFKRRELASHALHLVERDRLIHTAEEFLKKLQNSVPDEQVADLHSVLQSVERRRRDTEGWDVFDAKFRDLHGDFLTRLSAKYAPLSPMEEKVCMLTKLHLVPKEIAAVLHTGVRTVEAHRYRLRKKFGIGNEVNFVTFLNSL